MSNVERLIQKARMMDESQAAQVLDFAEYLETKRTGAAPGTFASALAWLDAHPEEELTPDEAAEIERRKEEDQAGAKRWTLEELGL